ncbi:MAG: FprA family A-type flavoprotein [Bacteroidales bacterium]|nr:FprA family A-type flavoprotein [Bacteroidales bacterium]
MTDQKTINLNKDVTWVGILDRDIITFDIVMETRYGTTYNSYFIDAEKKTLIDTAKETFKEDYFGKLGKIVNPREINNIVVTHTEPDHSGCLKHLLDMAPDAVVYGSRAAINYLQEMMNVPFRSQSVKDGDVLDLGNKTIRFISAPNLHWPDSIYAYLEEDQLLFTCDSFGAHYCHDAMFDDLTGDYTDSFTYYFDVILKPFSEFMLKAIEKIKPLKIRAVCPGHGPILRSTWKDKVQLTEKLAMEYISNTRRDDNAILIAYVSAYGYTKHMAEAIAEGIRQEVDFKITLVDIENISPGDLEELIVRSRSILVGSPTINQNTLLPVYKMFSVLNPIRDRGKKAAVFGSYGWSGEAVKIIENQLRALKLNVVMDGFSNKFSPDKGKLKDLAEFGRTFSRRIKSDQSESFSEHEH